MTHIAAHHQRAIEIFPYWGVPMLPNTINNTRQKLGCASDSPFIKKKKPIYYECEYLFIYSEIRAECETM